MARLKLYYFPGACSRVTMAALEEIGLPYETEIVDISRGKQKSPEMLAINPKGKVPGFQVDGRLLTENAAILFHLDQHYPQGGLLPKSSGALGENEALQDLVWCSSGLHPITRQIRNPARYSAGETDGIKANGMAAMTGILDGVAERLDKSPWWYGDTWSIVDTYLYWNYSTCATGGLDLSRWPVLADHLARVRDRPAFQRLLACEVAAADEIGLQAHGATL